MVVNKLANNDLLFALCSRVTLVVSNPDTVLGNEKIGLFSDGAKMASFRNIKALDISKGELISFVWTINGICGRLVFAMSPRAANFLGVNTHGIPPETVVYGVAFASESDYHALCVGSDARGIPRDDE